MILAITDVVRGLCTYVISQILQGIFDYSAVDL